MKSIRKSLVPPAYLLDGPKGYDHWICWDEDIKPDSSKPIPVDPQDCVEDWGLYRPTGPENKDVWMSLGEAESHRDRKENITGIGFSVRESPYCYVDLDDCVDPESMEVDPTAWSIVERLDSYTELSRSGTGLTVICLGDPPGDGWSHPHRSLKVDIRAKSWVVVTQDHVDETPKVATWAGDEIHQLAIEFRTGLHGE